MVMGEILNFIGILYYYNMRKREKVLNEAENNKIRIYICTCYIDHSLGCTQCHYRVKEDFFRTTK